MIRGITKSSLFKDSIIYGFSNALYTGLPLLLMPFLVVILQPEDYGIVELFRSFSLMLIPVIGLSTLASVDRFYFDLDTKKFQNLIGTLIIFHFVMALSVIFLLSLMIDFLPEKYYVIILLAIIYCLFYQIIEIYLVVLRVKRQAINFLKVRIGTVVLELSLLTLFYFIFTHHDWTFRIYPIIIAAVVIGIGICVLIFRFRNIPFAVDRDVLKQAIIFSAPLIIHMVAGYILNLSNRFFILHYNGEKVLGSFSLAYQIGMSISFFYTSFNMAWTPTFYSWMDNKKKSSIKKVRVLVYTGLSLGALAILLGWIFISPYISQIKNYGISHETIALLLLAFVLLSLYKFEGNYFFYHKKTTKLSLFTLLSCLVALILNFLLIPKFAVLGAAYSTLFSYFFLFMCVILFKQNNKEVKNV
ncbi:lipopolysaccharide biosynthesis protein [Sphingobacterium pedocola]|uniref:Polysaccharide biosynthesis protein C-terminal domain-containing protein n=1 Tax=Sphingobacterium pedocola TaxID=2082722 RepID=A0ABR9T9M7_9SPHI|nr:oligosaccharide flippase family protein [Sphingobacterium pedocola]MBE8722056.1 hypothetical protein [Sphingobacterium pedocola]